MYHGNANERHVRELHMVKNEEGISKRQPNGPDQVASRSSADALAAEPWSLPESISPFSPSHN